MSKNFVIAISLLMNVYLLCLVVAWSQTVGIVLETNKKLMEAVAVPHAVHDANLTVWHYDGGDVTIMVNGMFPHVYERFCVRT
jgi:hypothetical protein